MRVSFITYKPVSMTSRRNTQNRQRRVQNVEKEIARLLEPLSINKKAKVSPKNLMRGINPNNNDVFDTFSRIDDVTRDINFVRNHSQWNACLLEINWF